ncbi:MAG: alpha-amylase family glycosyl hydrolase [Anaerolineae bacterium]
MHHWWQTGVIYQIYPRSFMDASGDGVGDIPGVIERLDYLTSLGIDAIWLSPIYPSPMADFGYDISDYADVNPLFGSLGDFDRLVEAAHARGLRVILDLVPNHTSDQHPWFQASRAARDNPQRDWYIWRAPAPDGGPPNNWQSFFGGNAWTLDEATGQYYLHLFLKAQPDLNYRNPAVVEALLNTMRFWLDRGVDGFRVDVIWLMIKDEEFRDEPPSPTYQPGRPDRHRHEHIYTEDQALVHDIIRAMRRVLDSYEERMMVGEIYLPYERLMTYYGADMDECHMPFNFQLIESKWGAEIVRGVVEAYEAALPAGGWPNWVLGNHDRSRIGTRAGREQARVAMMLLLTLRGTPTCYYGDEIGMVDVDIPVEKWQDPAGLQQKDIQGESRDPERTPMQWDAGPNAGFCPPDVEPWLPLAPDYRQVNIAVEEGEQASMLHLFRRLTTLRRATPALGVGDYRSLDASGDGVFVYERAHEGQRVVVALNFTGDERVVAVSAEPLSGDVLLSTRLDREGPASLSALTLRPNEGIIIAVG